MADIKDGYGLPDTLPPLRLPSDADLARQAREIRLVRELAALAEWLGQDGIPVDDHETPPKDAWAEALTALGVSPARLRVLWTYALTVGWITVDPPDHRDEGGDEGGKADGRAIAGEVAGAWASGDDEDILDAWASAFAAVLSEAVSAAAGPDEDSGMREGADPEEGGIDIHAPGAALALVLFLSRRAGLFREEARGLVRDVMTGELPPDRAEQAWNDWVSAHGDPADILLGQLAEVGAVTLPPTDDGTIRATPLTLREMRNQLASEGVTIPLLPADAAELTAAQLLSMADGMPPEEFEAEADAWLSAHGPRSSAELLLGLAAESDPASRLTAVSVVARLGQAAEPAWEDNIGVPSLRPYAKVALACMALGITPPSPAAPSGLAPLPESVPPDALPPELRPLPEDMAWMAVDVLSLACADEDTDPRDIAAAFAQAVSAGQEAEVFDTLWRGPHPDTERVLSHLGRFHPDKTIAKQARRAAHQAASHRDGQG
ncbi:MAG: hypothetical protein J2P26_06210 [Nocardiopsaceae bacterium]|nr:hypothetical protein [Nocardiopsaceae bacterium]